MRSSLHLNENQDAGDHDRQEQRLYVDGTSLTSYPRELRRIGDCCNARIHVAQTARREPHSGLVTSMKDAERADPGRHKQDEPRGARRVKKEEDDGKESSGSERNDPQSETGSLAARADVGNHLSKAWRSRAWVKSRSAKSTRS